MSLVSTSEQRQAPATADGPGKAADPASRSKWPAIAITLVAAVLVVALGVMYVAIRNKQQVISSPPVTSLSDLRVTGLPPNVPTSLAALMGLSPVPTKSAPGFNLVDQYGKAISLAQFKGRAVALEFMDPHCVDICPIISQEFIDAYKDLGPAGSNVIFLAVNVNAYHADVASMAAYSNLHHLNTVPTWHFLTGRVSALQAVWHDYNVTVSAPSPDADVIHTSVLYFIDPDGRERYVAIPMPNYTATGSAYLPAADMASWGKGIALVSRSYS